MDKQEQHNTSKTHNDAERAKKVKVVAEYNVDKGKFSISDEDMGIHIMGIFKYKYLYASINMGILAAYDVDRERVKQTLERIERDIQLRPFEFE